MKSVHVIAALGLLLSSSLFAQQPRMMTGEVFDAELYNSLPLKAKISTRAILPPKVNLEKYCPTPGNQGEYMTCAAWSSAYHFRTIIEAKQRGLTNREEIDKIAFSPTWVYEILKKDGDDNCYNGLATAQSLIVFQQLGVPSISSLPFGCLPGPKEERFKLLDPMMQEASSAKIRDLQILFKHGDTIDPNEKIRSIKKVLAEGFPVLISHTLYNSFGRSKTVWHPEPGEELADEHGSHAMVIVGYDDHLHGGAFRYLNSWGPEWGDGGFLWVPYSVTGDLCYGAYQAYPFSKNAKPTPLPAPPVNVNPEPVAPHIAPSPAPPAPVAPNTPAGSLDFVTRTGAEMPVSRISTRGLVVEDASPDGEKEMSAYRMVETYPAGTRFRFYMTTETEGYVYAFASDLTKKVTRIFPYAPGISPLVGSNSVIAFPADDKVIRMDEQPGTDYLLVLFSQQALDLEKITATMNGAEGGLTRKIESALGAALIKQEEIDFQPGKVSFVVRPEAEGMVVPVMIEINRQ